MINTITYKIEDEILDFQKMIPRMISLLQMLFGLKIHLPCRNVPNGKRFGEHELG